MKTILRYATLIAVCTSTILSAQSADYALPQPRATGRTTLKTVQSANRESAPGQDVQMVTCTDKITYCDRNNTSVLTAALGGTNGFGCFYQVYPDYTGAVTELYVSAAKTGGNANITIGVFGLTSGVPNYNPIATITANVTTTTVTEYGSALSAPVNVTNGFAIGVYYTTANDSCNIGCRVDPDQRHMVYYDLGVAPVGNIYSDYGFEIDMLMRPKISFTGPIVTASANPTSGCVGTPIAFSSYGSGYPAHYNSPDSYDIYNVNHSTVITVPDPIYAWNFGDAGTDATQSPSHAYAATGTYTATATWTYTGWTTSCPTTPGTVPVTITGATSSVTISESANPVCPSQSVTFTATPTNGGPAPTYVWKKNGVQVGTTSSYAGTGWVGGDVMTCEMISNATCAPTTPIVSNSIVMYTQPLALSSYNYVATGLSVAFTSTSANAVSWAWNFGDAGTSASATPVHNYVTGGTYTVDLTTTNSCGQTNTSSINITISSTTNSNGGNTSVNEKDLQVDVAVFPNPVNNDLNIQYALNHPTDVTVDILNTLGQVVSTQLIQSASTGTAHVSMENIANGIYFVRFTAADQVQLTKIVRQ